MANLNIFQGTLNDARTLEREALKMLPSEIQKFITALIECENIAPDFAIKPIIHALAALAQAKVKFKVVNWDVNTATLTILIGPPSANKNALKQLRKLPTWKELEKRISSIRVKTADSPDGKTKTMDAALVLTNGTPQGVQMLGTAGLPHGVLWSTDEMLHLVTLFTDPRNERGQHSLELLKLMFEAGKIADVKKTVRSDNGILHGSFIGNIQPSLWTKWMAHIRDIDTGTLQRFTYLKGAAPIPKKVKQIPTAISDKLNSYVEKYINIIDSFDTDSEISADKPELFVDFHFELQKLAAETPLAQISNYILKQNYYVLKYSLMHHLLNMRGMDSIKKDSFEFAVKMVRANIIRFIDILTDPQAIDPQYKRRVVAELYHSFNDRPGMSFRKLEELTGIPKSTIAKIVGRL